MSATPAVENKKPSLWARFGKNIIRIIGSVILTASVLAMFYLWIAPQIWPARTAHIRAAEKARDTLIEKEAEDPGLAGDSLQELAENYSGNLEGTEAAGSVFATKLALTSNVGESWVDRASGRIPVIPIKAVLGNQNSWVTMTSVHEPVHVMVSAEDTIKPHAQSRFESNAEGIFPDGLPAPYEGDLTVIMKDRLDRGMQMTQPGNLFELIGRVCGEGVCTPAYPQGTDSIICPNPGGIYQAWYNGRVEIDGVPTRLAFAQGIGQYRLTVVPDKLARQVCAAHPGETIVKVNGGN